MIATRLRLRDHLPWGSVPQASVQYQREIVRLRSIIGQMDPKLIKTNPMRGGAAGGNP